MSILEMSLKSTEHLRYKKMKKLLRKYRELMGYYLIVNTHLDDDNFNKLKNEAISKFPEWPIVFLQGEVKISYP